MKLVSIWAQDSRGVLGDGEGMLWSVPADLTHFKQSTLGAPVIMGRSSFEALPAALPDRPNIVVTTQEGYVAENAQVVHSVEEAIELAEQLAKDIGADTVWVTGGATLYQQTMGLVDEVVLTDLDITVPGDVETLVVAPHLDEDQWRADPQRSDTQWRPKSGDAQWKVTTYVRR